MAQLISSDTIHTMSKPSWNITQIKYMLCHQEYYYKIK